MQALEIKSVLLRSNPQQIRQLVVPYEITFAKLHEILQIVIGRRQSCDYEFVYKECVIKEASRHERQRAKGNIKSSALRVADTLQEGDCLLYCFGKDMLWKVRLTVEIVQDAYTGSLPAVIRYRGSNLPLICEDVPEFNRQQHAWEEAGWYRGYGGVRLTASEYRFSQAAVNAELSVLYGNGDEETLRKQAETISDFVPDLSKCFPIRELLSSRRVADLKELAKNAGIELPPNLRKQQLIDVMTAGYGMTQTAKDCFRKMRLQEYEAMRKLCRDPDAGTKRKDMRDYIMLIRCGFVEYEPGYNNIYCSRELVNSYAELVRSGFERPFLKYLKTAAAIRVGCQLYGIVPKEIVLRLLDKCFPKEFTAEEAEAACGQFAADNSDAYVLTSEGIFMEREGMGEREAEFLARLSPKIPWYLPERSELELLDRDGLFFDKEAGKEIETYLRRTFSVREDWLWYYNRQIYMGLHLGVEPQAIAEWLLESMGRTTGRSQMAYLEKWMKEQLPNVRQIILRGHTPNEMEAIQKEEQSQRPSEKKIRIFPNSPCPCGSGKKYKKCCGRR